MKTKDFAKIIANEGFIFKFPKEKWDGIEIWDAKNKRQLALVSTKHHYTFEFFDTMTEEFWISNKADWLIDTVVEFAKTPIEERKSEKQYRFKIGKNYVFIGLDGLINPLGVNKDNSVITKEYMNKLPFDVYKAIDSGIISLEVVD